MLFSTYTFIFVFLPVVFIGYAILSFFDVKLSRKIWLIIASLFFYGYWDVHYLFLLMASAFFNYYIGCCLLKLKHNQTHQKKLLIFGVVCNLLLIGYFKYFNFMVDNLNDIFETGVGNLDIILPLGISFFTFQNIAYLVDVKRNKVLNNHFLDYLFFLSFFPQLIAGPIVHHADIMKQINSKLSLKLSLKKISVGLSVFLLGLFKKLALADSISVYADLSFNAVHEGVILSFWEAWCGVLAYTFQLYFDFSGYSDMAIGLGLIFGLRLPINFFSPYKAENIIDFWRRWHMTLSAFLRDYLYIPLGGNRNGFISRYRNLFITMLLGGLWHGASWTFVLWGGLHGLYLCLNHIFRNLLSISGRYVRLGVFDNRLLFQGITFLSVVTAWVPFRAESLSDTMSLWTSMFTLDYFGLSQSVLNLINIYFPGMEFKQVGMFYNGLGDWSYGCMQIILLSSIVFFLPNSIQLMRFQVNLTNFKPGGMVSPGGGFIVRNLIWSPSTFWAFIYAGIFLAIIMLLSQESPFIYFQF